jgi:protein-export membrane protein SecD
MLQIRFGAFALVVAGLLVGYFVYVNQMPGARFPFKYGLDLVGGTQLTYEADTSSLSRQEVPEAMRALRDVIERRVNLFGVSEPLVQSESASVFSQGTSSERLIVELPGVTDINEAIELIGATPVLEFKLVKNTTASSSDDRYAVTGLTGRYLTHAQLEFRAPQGGVAESIVVLTFNDEGKELFGKITREHVGEQLAIFLDGQLLSEPVIREAIEGGQATISGKFNPEEARELVRNLNIGALPVPITLASSQTVGATLGGETLAKGIKAGLIGLGLVGLFMILWYRLPGLVAVVALAMYVVISFAFFKLIPITLSASGIAGFILSIGMAVDANVLIFERIKEELRKGLAPRDAVRAGFSRAWPAIRDGHLTMLISSVVLFWIGTSIVQGFALVFGLGVIISLFSAVSVSRVFLLAIVPQEGKGILRALMTSGFNFK